MGKHEVSLILHSPFHFPARVDPGPRRHRRCGQAPDGDAGFLRQTATPDPCTGLGSQEQVSHRRRQATARRRPLPVTSPVLAVPVPGGNMKNIFQRI